MKYQNNIGIGSYEGENAASKATQLAMDALELNNNSINYAEDIGIIFKMHSMFSMLKFIPVIDLIFDSIDEDARLSYEFVTDDNLTKDYVSVTIQIIK